MTNYLLILATSTLIGAICAFWAKSRNKDPFAWFAVGFFLNIAGLAVFSVIDKRIPRKSN